MRVILPIAIILIALPLPLLAADADTAPAAHARFKHGPPADANFFPVAVWLQSPRNAARYKAAGFNTFVGLWKGPTEQQLAELKAAGMKVICDQNEVGLKHRDDPTIIGWMHDDEPDNAQPLPGGKGYGPPVAPEKIVAGYQRMRNADPTRPVLLNLGQGVAWDGWYGRGVRTNHPEDYPEYVKGCDIASFDIYPVVHDKPEVADKLWYVAYGVRRLDRWCQMAGGKTVWNCVECTRISNEKMKPTPAQVRAEVWMGIIHGSRGIIYFAHQFKPRFVEAALLEDAEMLAAVTKTNKEIRELAGVIDSPEVERVIHEHSPARQAEKRTPGDALARELREQGQSNYAVESKPGDAPVDVVAARRADADFIFAVSMTSKPVLVRISRRGMSGKALKPVEVLGESRRITRDDTSAFEDEFAPYAVHIYRIPR